MDDSPSSTKRSAAKVAAELFALLEHELREKLLGEVESLRASVDELAERLESTGATTASAPVLGGGAPASAQSLKEAMNAVLLESGLLESLVSKVVERQIGTSGDGVAGALRKTAAVLVKEFLAENLGKVFRSEIEGVVARQIAQLLSSDRVKELIDDKFRAIAVHIRTELIPKAVRQALQETS